MPTTLMLATLCAFAPSAAAEDGASGHRPLQYVGYYHDGSGVFPDCTPVTTWNEWDFREEREEYESNGKKKSRTYEVPDRENQRNIVYKVPHYNWCNGGMIIVGGKLFALSDRGGFGFYLDRAPDFVGAELFCIDPATGKELWKRDLDHWDLVPDGERLRQLLRDYNRRQLEAARAFIPLGTAVRASHSGAPFTEEDYQRLSAPLKGLVPDLPSTYADANGHVLIDSGYVQLHFFKKVQPKYWPEIAEMRKELQNSGYLMDPWGCCGAPLGLNMQTPVSDGERIYISTAYGATFCLDLDGKVVWKRWFGGGMDRAPAIPSPVLVGDLLLITNHDPEGKANKGAIRMALDKANGRTVWTAPYGGGYQCGPVALDLPVGGDSTKTMTVLYYQGDGVVLRAADGRRLAEGLPACWTGRPPAVAGDIVVANNKIADGGHCGEKNEFDKGWAAFRLRAESTDRIAVETLWHGKDWGWSNVIARENVLFHMDGKPNRGHIESYDLVSGEPIAKASGPVTGSFHYTILVGDHLMGLDMKGYSGVARVSPDGKTLEAIATNRLGDRLYGQKGGPPLDGKFSYGCQFFASGNRIFIRSMTDLYCIGDPEAETVLSPGHR